MIFTNSLYLFVLMTLFGFLAPVLLMLFWKLKTKEPIWPALVGAGVFLVFALILESIPKLVLLQTWNPVGRYVTGNLWLYALTAALLAGIFEETGRFFAFRFFLKKRTNRETAITYGIGHGGFEVMMFLGIGGIQNLIYAILIASGQFNVILNQVAAVSPDQVAQLQALREALGSMTLSMLGCSVLERVSAVLVHLSCSIIVFTAVRAKGKMWLYPVAILLHTGIDVLAVLYQTGIISGMLLFELILLAIAMTMFLVCYFTLYRRFTIEKQR